MGSAKPIPDGYHSITPHLIVKGATRAIDFYRKAFGARELYRMSGRNGRVGHAELQIGDSRIMLADEHPDMDVKSPQTIGGSAFTIHLYVEDVDATVERAIAAGAELKQPVENRFYGDRNGCVRDPFGHTWYVSTHVEDVPADELQRRAAKRTPPPEPTPSGSS
jgi:PhnB protein